MRSRLEGFWTRKEVQALVSSDIPPRVVLEKLKQLYPRETANLKPERISRARWMSRTHQQTRIRRVLRRHQELPAELQEPVTEVDKTNLILRTTRRMFQLESEQKVLHEQLSEAEAKIQTLVEELAESRRLLEVLRGKHTTDSLAVAGGNVRSD